MNQPRNPLGQFETIPRFDTIKRYFSDPVFAAQVDADRHSEAARIADEISANQAAWRAKRAAEREIELLTRAGIGEDEAQAIAGMAREARHHG